MLKQLRMVRRRIMTPDQSATRRDVRGFHRKDAQAVELLETVGRSFLTGFAYAAEAATPAAAEQHLETVEHRFRGFAYEGAAMACAVIDGLPFASGTRVNRFLDGRGANHVYMAYVGIGWALARLPRWRWSRIPPRDPLLRWLVLDGYGFHQAYFHTDRYVSEQFQERSFPWAHGGPQSYARRVIDQGIGRALWFVAGTDVDLVSTMIDKFDASRRADLYAGAGLAATYAGGVDEVELRAFARLAGAHYPQVAQGCVFAATARVRAGLVVPHTDLATKVLCDLTPEEATALSDAALPTGPVRGELPAYEVWRQRIAHEFTSKRR